MPVETVPTLFWKIYMVLAILYDKSNFQPFFKLRINFQQKCYRNKTFFLYKASSNKQIIVLKCFAILWLLDQFSA